MLLPEDLNLGKVVLLVPAPVQICHLGLDHLELVVMPWTGNSLFVVVLPVILWQSLLPIFKALNHVTFATINAKLITNRKSFLLHFSLRLRFVANHLSMTAPANLLTCF